MENKSFFSGNVILWTIVIVIMIGFIVILVRRIAVSMAEAAQNNGRINQYLAAIPADRIGTVNAIYQNSRKQLGTALILAIIGAGFGYHNIYLGRRRAAIFMFLFFWTGIPTIISLFDLSTMAKTVSEYNLSIVQSLYEQLAAPKIE